jgi:hypothetical protein
MNARALLAYVAPSLRAAQKCAACGEEFHCGASVWGCWCAEVKLTDAQRAALRAKYRGCLCRNCLEKAARNP